MKRFSIYILLLAVAVSCFVWEKSYRRMKKRNRAKVVQAVFPVIEEKPFVFVIPSYNNEAICERTLRSCFEQNYSNYRVIYIDDASTDKTYEKVKAFIQKENQEKRCTLIRNEKNLGGMENLYRAIHSCLDHEIVITLDGDDWLAHDWVLEKLNACYANPDIWLAYGSYMSYPAYTRGECSRPIPREVLKESRLRSYMDEVGTVASHLRSFYAGFCKQVKLQDVLYEGHFLPSTWDAGIMLPMLEMAQSQHISFVQDILYIYNRANPLNDDKVKRDIQQACSRYVRALPSYKPAEGPFIMEEDRGTADLIVFSYNRPLQLYGFLESLQAHTKHCGQITVIYRTDEEAFARAYEEVKEQFPSVVFYQQSQEPLADFKPLVLQAFAEGRSNYVVFAVDDIIVKDAIDFRECITALKETGAYGFYLRLGTHLDYCYMLDRPQAVPQAISLQQDICAWQFKVGQADWQYPNCLDMTLYSKEEIKQDLKELEFVHPNNLEALWAARADLNKVGLCYEKSKIVNIPLSLVNPSSNRNMNSYSAEELLTLFNQGLKIDVVPLFQIENKAAHMEYNPTFIKR